MAVEKVIRAGLVAVVYSPEYGAGWSTWSHDASPFDPAVVAWIEGGKVGPGPYLEPLEGPYNGGLHQAEIVWLPVGTRFHINEYDGHESLEIIDPDYGWVA